MVAMLKDRKAYSSTFWALFIGLVVLPVFALAFDVGRYLYARQEIGKAADAAAVAAVVEINQRAFMDSGELHPTQETYAMAQTYATMNNDYLGGLGIYPRVTDIQINDAKDTVYVAVSADISVLFPSIVPTVIVTETGTAQVRAFK
jgi:Flp pilus assembly protein TadG